MLSDNPVVFYTFEDGCCGHTPSSFADSSPNQFDASPVGSPTIQLGPFGDSAVRVTGNDYAEGPTAFAGDESRTVELLFDNISGAADSCLFNAGVQAHDQSFSICVTDGNQFASPTPGSAGVYIQTYDSDVYLPGLGVDQQGWHYLAVSLTGSQLTVNFDDTSPSGFIWDGTSYSSLAGQPFTLPNDPGTAPTPVDIGGPGWATGGSVQVDEAAVYTPALSGERLDAHYQAAFGLPAPTVTGVSPAQGSTDGGTGVTITGTNFAAGATVSFGGAAATNVVVDSSTSITATSPAQGSASAFGPVDVVVTSNGQVSATSSADVFTYVSQDAVTGRVIEGNPTALITGPVATITDPDTNAPVTAFHAAINWGDGSATSAGQIARSQTTPTQLTVTGAHRYASAATWPIVVAITKTGANPRSANALAEVYGSKWDVASRAVAGRAVGLLTFQTRPGGTFHACTATVVDTPDVNHGGNMSLIMTAAHCVFANDAGGVFGDGINGAFYGSFEFAPGHSGGNCYNVPVTWPTCAGRKNANNPYGVWASPLTPGLSTATSIVIDPNEMSASPPSHAYDYALIVLSRTPELVGSAGSVRIQQAVGGLPLSLDSANNQPWAVYGYPGADVNPNDPSCGGRCDPLVQRSCGGTSKSDAIASTTGNGEAALPSCRFQPGGVTPLAGDSGSPWLNSLNAIPGISSVLTYISPATTIHGPWLGPADNVDQHLISAALLCALGGSCP